MYAYAPLEYQLLTEWSKTHRQCYGKYSKFSPSIIEAFCIYSGNPVFKSERFRIAFINYKKDGLKPLHKAKWRLQDAVYFAQHAYNVYEDMKKCAL